MTKRDTIIAIAIRASILADIPIDGLKSFLTELQRSSNKATFRLDGLTVGQLVGMILVEEFAE